jgi:hypothetical protein
LFTRTLLMAYSKAKFKSNGDKAFPYFKPFLTGELSDICLSTRTLQLVSFRNTFISLTCFKEMPNSIRTLCKTSLLNESYTFLKSINSWRTTSLDSHFFSSIWQMQNIWSVVNMLRRNPH